MTETKKKTKELMQEENMDTPKKRFPWSRGKKNQEEKDSLQEEEIEEEPEEKPEEKPEMPKEMPKEMTQEEKQRIIEDQIIALRDPGVFHLQVLQILQTLVELQNQHNQFVKGIGNNLIEIGKVWDEKLGEVGE